MSEDPSTTSYTSVKPLYDPSREDRRSRWVLFEFITTQVRGNCLPHVRSTQSEVGNPVCSVSTVGIEIVTQSFVVTGTSSFSFLPWTLKNSGTQTIAPEVKLLCTSFSALRTLTSTVTRKVYTTHYHSSLSSRVIPRVVYGHLPNLKLRKVVTSILGSHGFERHRIELYFYRVSLRGLSIKVMVCIGELFIVCQEGIPYNYVYETMAIKNQVPKGS